MVKGFLLISYLVLDQLVLSSGAPLVTCAVYMICVCTL